MNCTDCKSFQYHSINKTASCGQGRQISSVSNAMERDCKGFNETVHLYSGATADEARMRLLRELTPVKHKDPPGCHDCFYMRKDNATTVENMVDKVIQFIPVMECRRQPPLGSKNLMEGGIWHRVKGCDWCGEWREKA